MKRYMRAYAKTRLFKCAEFGNIAATKESSVKNARHNEYHVRFITKKWRVTRDEIDRYRAVDAFECVSTRRRRHVPEIWLVDDVSGVKRSREGAQKLRIYLEPYRNVSLQTTIRTESRVSC